MQLTATDGDVPFPKITYTDHTLTFSLQMLTFEQLTRHYVCLLSEMNKHRH